MAHRKSEIDRYVDGGLPPEREAALRDHLRSCDECRAHYDRQRRLARALAGDANVPSPRENARIVNTILGGATKDARDSFPSRPWFAVACAAAIALLVAGWLLLGSRSAPGTLVLGEGVLLAGHPGHSGSAVRGEVRVGPLGKAEVALARGGSIRIEPDTTVVLSPDRTSVELLVGKISCDITPSSHAFSVRTAAGDVRVLGTTFAVAYALETGASVWVTSGSVELGAAGGGAVRLQAGERSTLAPNGTPSMPERFDAVPAADGLLDLAVDPWAEVFLDGVHIDTTPLAAPIRVPPGAHRLELRNPGMKLVAEDLVIESGVTVRRKIRLEALPK